MKYIKTYENLHNYQEPFFLTPTADMLYLSDDLAKSILPNFKNKIGKYNEWYINKELENQKHFFNNTVDEKGYLKARRISLDTHVSYNNDMYRMNLSLSRRTDGRKTTFGTYYCYLVGDSGDHSMHGKNMIRATRDCNLNFIIKLYPIVKHIKNFYKIFKTGEFGFLEIIKNALDKDIMLAQYGVPKELLKDPKYKDMEGYIKGSMKYNL